MEQKIIRVFPSPVKEVTEDETIFVNQVTENTSARAYSVAAATELAGTKTLDYTAAAINDKLGHVNSYATVYFTSDSYVPAILFATDSGGESKIDANFIIVSYGNYTGDGNTSANAIINVKLWVKSGRVQTRKLSCIAGKIDTSKFEILVCDNTQVSNRYAIFIKSNGFRGFMYVRELSIDLFNTSLYLYTNFIESTSLPGWYIYGFRYDNIASELKGYTTPFEMKIRSIPTSKDDLFQCLFGGEGQGPDNWMDLFANIESSILPQIVLTCNVGNYSFATITTNVDMEVDEDLMEFIFQLYFVYFGKYYNLGFRLGDDGVAVPGSASVTIKPL